MYRRQEHVTVRVNCQRCDWNVFRDSNHTCLTTPTGPRGLVKSCLPITAPLSCLSSMRKKQAADPESLSDSPTRQPVFACLIGRTALPPSINFAALRPRNPLFCTVHNRLLAHLADAGIGPLTSPTTNLHTNSRLKEGNRERLVTRLAGSRLPSFSTPRVSSGYTGGGRPLVEQTIYIRWKRDLTLVSGTAISVLYGLGGDICQDVVEANEECVHILRLSDEVLVRTEWLTGCRT